jgi:hypothetical protein
MRNLKLPTALVETLTKGEGIYIYIYIYICIAGTQWLLPIILAIQEAEIRRTKV